VGLELQKQLEAAGNAFYNIFEFLHWWSFYQLIKYIADLYLVPFTELELQQVEVLFNEATDNCINMKKPD
jgi:hypothetical protein